MSHRVALSLKCITFIDIDGTLLDAHYHMNCSTIRGVIEDMQNEGFMFALNSNRSLVDIVPIAEQLHIDGPLIVENGIFYATRHDAKRHMLIADSQAKDISRLKALFEAKFKSEIEKRAGKAFAWLESDTVDALSNLENMQEFAIGTVVILNNQFRQYTTSAHVLRQGSNGLAHAETSLIDSICESVRQWADENDFTVTRGYEFANIIACTKSTSKRTAVVALQKMYPDASFVAIGNEYSDAMMIEGVGEFYAVANAMDSAKREASFVASSNTTRGVEEILGYIRRKV